MQIHELKHKTLKGKRRIGRGGKRGTYSGRGQKGQNSRSGRKKRPAMRDIILRFPKKRGFRNKPKSEKMVVLNLSSISKIVEGKISLEVLIGAGLIPKKSKSVKILGNGEINSPKEFSGVSVSSSAKAKIEKAGGKIV